MSETPWIHKYLPKNSKEILGQDKAVSQINEYINSFNPKKPKSCLIYGPVGCGKTSAVHAIANERMLEIKEMNASDFRDKENVQALLGTASKQKSLFFKGKIILIDEIDSLSGTKDKGGLDAIISVIEESAFPVICTVNNAYDEKLSKLRKISILIEFQTLDYRTIANKLKIILEKEHCSYDEEALKSLARRSGNDMRSAINDLQTLTSSGKKKLDIECIKELENNERIRTENILNAILKVLKTTDISVAKSAFENVDEDIDEISLWLEENIPKEYKGEDLKNAFMVMSKADVYKGRIKRWQHWRFLVYIYALYSAGIALSKKEKYKEYIKYTKSNKALELWTANMKYMKRKAIAEKIAEKNHCSSNLVIKELIPYLKIMCRKKEFSDKLKKEYSLQEDEIEWLTK